MIIINYNNIFTSDLVVCVYPKIVVMEFKQYRGLSIILNSISILLANIT